MRICFVMPYCYPLFNPAIKHVFGGSEARAFLFARKLADRGHQVSFIVMNHGQNDIEEFAGIKVYRFPDLKSGDGWFETTYSRFFRSMRLISKSESPGIKEVLMLPILFLLLAFGKLMRNFREVEKRDWRSLFKGTGAEYFATFGVSDLAAEIFSTAKNIGKKCVLFTGSDYDFLDIYYEGSIERNKYGTVGALGFRAVQSADEIIVQTQNHLGLLNDRYNRAGTVVRNAIEVAAPTGNASFSDRDYVLWVGKSDGIKRPDRLIDLARLCPEIKFLAVMNKSDLKMHMEIEQAKPENVQIVDHVPFDQIQGVFQKAIALVNTSDFEGFPNTFLQAGLAGAPVLSYFVDPDSFISAYGCGLVSGGDEKLAAEFLIKLSRNENLWRDFSRNIHSYTEKFHSLDNNVEALESIFKLRSKATLEPLATV